MGCYLQGLDGELSLCITGASPTAWHEHGPMWPHKLLWIKSPGLWRAPICATMSHVRCAAFPFLSLLVFSLLFLFLDALFLPVAVAMSALICAGGIARTRACRKRTRWNNGNGSETRSNRLLGSPQGALRTRAETLSPWLLSITWHGRSYLLRLPQALLTSRDWERWWR